MKHYPPIYTMSCLLLLLSVGCSADAQHDDDMAWHLESDQGADLGEDLPNDDKDLSEPSEEMDEAPDLREDMNGPWIVPQGMVDIPEGLFLMGSYRDGALLFQEYPEHQVYLSRYAIDQFEVSAGQYAQCVDEGACTVPGLTQIGSQKEEWCNYGRPRQEEYPINCVTWQESDAYCKWAGKHLPTEAQWEKAARGPNGNPYTWGEAEPSCELFAAKGCSSEEEATWPIEGKAEDVSVYGVRNLMGNVEEWTLNYAYNYNTLEQPVRDPMGPETGEHRVIRGASAWESLLYTAPLSERLMSAVSRNYLGAFVGFRCAYSGPDMP